MTEKNETKIMRQISTQQVCEQTADLILSDD
jgi:hypothetical protein